MAHQKARSLGKRLYTFFGIQNSFPSVNQDALWVKLAGWGASGPLID